MLSWHFSSFFFLPMIKPNSHLFPLENNTIHTCIKRAFVRYFHAIQETIYISKIKKSVMNIKIKTVSNFLHLIILHIGAHITLEQIKEVVGTTIGSLCFPLVWLFCDRGIFFFYIQHATLWTFEKGHLQVLTRTGVLLLNDKNVLMNRTSVVCDWFFFGRAEIFVGILTINGKIVSVLN